MQRNGIEVLGDDIDAVRLQLEELKMFKQNQISELERKLSNLEKSNTLALQQTGRGLPTYTNENTALKGAIERAKNKTLKQFAAENNILLPESSMAIIQNILSGSAEFKASKRPFPIRSFTPATMEKIEAHRGKLPPQLQKLIDAAIGDNVTEMLAASPVFVQGDGHIYDHLTLNKILETNKGRATCPENPAITYTANDIIPCDTLFDAVKKLIDIIDNGEVGEVPPKKKYTTLAKSERKRIPENLIPMIEMFYKQMPNKHKALFDIICRDQVTGNIMDDPVFLPDGNVYDRSAAMYLLERENGVCRLNPEVRFTKNEITPCYFVINVLLQLKENIEEQIKLKKQAPSPDAGDAKQVYAKLHEPLSEDKESKIVSLEKRAAELQQLIEKSKKELEEVQSQLTLLRGDKPSSNVRP